MRKKLTAETAFKLDDVKKELKSIVDIYMRDKDKAAESLRYALMIAFIEGEQHQIKKRMADIKGMVSKLSPEDLEAIDA